MLALPFALAKVDHGALLGSSAVAKLRTIHYPDLQRAVRLRPMRESGSDKMLHCYRAMIRATPPGALGSWWCNTRIDLMDHCESLSSSGLEAMGSLISLTAVTTLNSQGGHKTKAAPSRWSDAWLQIVFVFLFLGLCLLKLRIKMLFARHKLGKHQ